LTVRVIIVSPPPYEADGQLLAHTDYFADTSLIKNAGWLCVRPRTLAPQGIARIHCHGEKSAAYMADGYARASGRPGIYEFLFVAPALPITGAVGSPINPLAAAIPPAP
jgi:hypothetical protein